MGNCDWGNCSNDATQKGFVVLRGLNPDGTVQTHDVNACDIHKYKDGFFPYLEESTNEK